MSKIYIIVKHEDARQFAVHANLKKDEWSFISPDRPEKLQGLYEPIIAFMGDVWKHKHFYEILNYLKAAKAITLPIGHSYELRN